MSTDPHQGSDDDRKLEAATHNDQTISLCGSQNSETGNTIENGGNLSHHGEMRQSINNFNSSCRKTNCSDDNWKDLQRLVSDFHHLVDVELRTLLEDNQDYYHHGHDESSRRHFDLRRCFRNLQDLLLRESLLNLLDEEKYVNDDEYNRDDEELYRNMTSNTNHTDPVNSTSDEKDDASHLIKMFANDLVQLSTISVFDNEPGNNWNRRINDFGIQELHRSLVVLAANRFPVKATLDDDQISQLLSRVLSLIVGHQYKLGGGTFQSQSQNQKEIFDFEPLQSLLFLLNREAAIERLSGGVILDCDEAASVLRIPLDFFDEIAKRSSRYSPSPVYNPYALLPPQFVLSLRILIDLLLGVLNSLVVASSIDRANSQSTDSNASFSCSSTPFSLRQWMTTSGQQEHQASMSGGQLGHLDLLRLLKLLDKYALELVEETLELLRPQRKPPPLEFLHESQDGQRHDQQQGRAVGKKRGRHDDNNRDIPDHSPKTPMTPSSQRQRVVRVLQHAAITTNFFAIMEASASSFHESTSGTNGETSVTVGLSRSFWNSLGRFVIEEVDTLDPNDNDTINFWENYENEDREDRTDGDTIEECQIAATDILYRLTKIQTEAILLKNRKSDTTKTSDSKYEGSRDGPRARSIKIIASSRYDLSEVEFSIITTTILRLLDHPKAFWTAESQSWVAALLEIREDYGKHNNTALGPSSLSSNTPVVVDVGARLRRVLQAAHLCTSYVPDGLPFEEQHRVNLSLKDLLLLSANRARPLSNETRTTVGYASMGSKVGETLPKEVPEDPWNSFWSVHQQC